jgi:hypothetical protein
MPKMQAAKDRAIEAAGSVDVISSSSVPVEKEKLATAVLSRPSDLKPQPTPQTTTRVTVSENEAQQRAIRLYPDLGVAGSALNQEFVARYRRYKTDRPAFFKDPEWPTALARECMAERILKR